MSQPYPLSGGHADRALVTGDAVVLDLRLAQLPSRAMALGIDVALQLLLLAVLGGALAAAPSSVDDAALQALSLVVVVGVILGYPVTVETLTRGRSLGKLAFGLRVVRDDGGPERFRQALLRGLTEVVEVWLTFGVVALVASLASSRGKRVGDVFAGTVVVRERVPDQGGQAASMPPQLVPWALSADLAQVPDELALAARQLIARWPDLDPATRQAMAARLATEVARHVAPPSPPGTSAEAYLHAVLAERRRREDLRLANPGSASHPSNAPAPSPPQPAVPPQSPTPQSPTPPMSTPPMSPRPRSDPDDGFALPG